MKKNRQLKWATLEVALLEWQIRYDKHPDSGSTTGELLRHKVTEFWKKPPEYMVCVQLFNNIYPFPLSQTAPATDLCQNTKKSDQPDRGIQAARANQTPARWAVREHQTETGITGWDGSERAAPNWPANRRRPAQPTCSRQNSRG
jgi:hypothetical protein